MKHLSAALRSYFNLGVGVPITGVPTSMQFEGAMVDAGSMVGALTSINNFNIADAAVNFQTSAAASLTLTNVQNLWQRLTNGGAVVVTLDSAYNIVTQMPNAFNGQTFGLLIAATGATTVAAPTLSDTAVTLVGTTTVLAAACRWYQGQITQLSTTTGVTVTAGTTFTSIAQVGSTNNFTVTLATNAISPTVGTVIFLNVTAGTLPSGWYPINKVTSATSFVIATPPGTVWTATAATVGLVTTVPVSQYTPGFPGIFSPLMNITGIMATATAVITV